MERLSENIWHDFVWNNLPVRELANKYEEHPNTIRKSLHNYKPRPINLRDLSQEEKDKIKVIAMDATFKIVVDSLCHKHISMNEEKFYNMFINWYARHKIGY